jgi:peptide/nickel transport system substrate-binding protein
MARILVLIAVVLGLISPAYAEQSVIRAVMNGDLRAVDPLWTIVPQTRTHAYMVYDTLFGIDANRVPQPQMVDTWTVSDDKLVYRFRLRPHLAFSDGAPVTSTDVLASLKRWMQIDPAGQFIAQFLTVMEPEGADGFVFRLKEPFPQLLYAIGRVSAVPTFIYPARVVDGLPVSKAFTDPTGSGPFIMKRDEWVAGSKVVYVKNPNYVPRAEPPSAIAGGKKVYVDRVEWMNITDPSTQVSALKTGEIDFIQFAPPDLIEDLRRTKGIVVQPTWPVGTQGMMRLNWTNPPMDKQGVRVAIQNFVHQPDMIMAVLGDMKAGQVCGAFAMCGSPMGNETGAEMLLSKDPEEVRLQRGMKMLKDAGYNGEPIVIMDATDQVMQHNATLVLADAMRKAGVNVDLQTIDWAALTARRTNRGTGPNGWHIFLTTGGQIGGENPAFSMQAPATCEKAFPGWACDAEYEKLRMAWLKESDPAKAKALAVEIQRRAMQVGVAIPYGQYLLPAAWRDTVEGVVQVPEHVVFWGMRKRE